MIARADDRPSQTDTTASFWLDHLKEAHANLLGAIDELARLTSGPLPDREPLIDVRWKVSEASLARRLLWGRVHAFLAKRVDRTAEQDLRHLQEMDGRLIRASATHISRWSADAIIADWAGYGRASERMRRQMIDAVGEETRLLYPILQTLERQRPA